MADEFWHARALCWDYDCPTIDERTGLMLLARLARPSLGTIRVAIASFWMVSLGRLLVLLLAISRKALLRHLVAEALELNLLRDETLKCIGRALLSSLHHPVLVFQHRVAKTQRPAPY